MSTAQATCIRAQPGSALIRVGTQHHPMRISPQGNAERGQFRHFAYGLAVVPPENARPIHSFAPIQETPETPHNRRVRPQGLLYWGNPRNVLHVQNLPHGSPRSPYVLMSLIT